MMKKRLLCVLLLLIPAWVYAEPNAALLASSCAACHGTNGHSKGNMPSLAGLSPDYFIEQMRDFVSGERNATVMHHHAAAYTENEIRLLAEYFAKQ